MIVALLCVVGTELDDRDDFGCAFVDVGEETSYLTSLLADDDSGVVTSAMFWRLARERSRWPCTLGNWVVRDWLGNEFGAGEVDAVFGRGSRPVVPATLELGISAQC